MTYFIVLLIAILTAAAAQLSIKKRSCLIVLKEPEGEPPMHINFI